MRAEAKKLLPFCGWLNKNTKYPMLLWLVEHICLLRKMPVSQDELRILYQYMPHYTVVCVTIDHSSAPQGLKDYINHLQSPVYVLNSDSTPILICRIDTDDQTAVQYAMENIFCMTG